ncbi:MAG TPA: phospholipase [Flavobacterium sp.]|nr:phospholipase [Flavobacterium sp.]
MELHHIVKEPKNKLDKNPALILLHGYGSNEEDLFSFASEFPEEYFIISAQAPLNLMYGSYAWYAINFDADASKFSDINQAVSSRDVVANFIDQCIEKYHLDAAAINLFGFSQGAILSMAVALSYPKKINKVGAFSGYLNTDILRAEGINKSNNTTKFFISHGIVDQVIPVEWARKSKPYLENLGIDVVYKEYPMGHGISPQNFFDFKNWLISK